MSLENLPAEMRQKIISFLKMADMNRVSKVCTLLHRDTIWIMSQKLVEKVDFFFPNYNKKCNVDLAKINDKEACFIWNQIPEEGLYKEFYYSIADLFKSDKKAQGCYRVNISLEAFKSASAKFKKNENNIEFLLCDLGLKKEDIKSYLSKDNKELLRVHNKTRNIEEQTQEQMSPTLEACRPI